MKSLPPNNRQVELPNRQLAVLASHNTYLQMHTNTHTNRRTAKTAADKKTKTERRSKTAEAAEADVVADFCPGNQFDGRKSK